MFYQKAPPSQGGWGGGIKIYRGWGCVSRQRWIHDYPGYLTAGSVRPTIDLYFDMGRRVACGMGVRTEHKYRWGKATRPRKTPHPPPPTPQNILEGTWRSPPQSRGRDHMGELVLPLYSIWENVSAHWEQSLCWGRVLCHHPLHMTPEAISGNYYWYSYHKWERG